MNELDILKLVAKRLEGAGINYMLSGSVALTFYGKPRMTRDIDIVIMIPHYFQALLGKGQFFRDADKRYCQPDGFGL
jgi:hypothetical protein